ncbi:2-succinyl-6-hydroxy-2,4-cyclohexadiene-1-carboxylate synthase [Psychromonas ossibalaenae]|uniref:2-succinyl-6-hydroxy-2, 4-cyclohexadiene-1-carboxylate synthase n=1 Tax=Psychromonas ossibalaenae TaxID=444922 RepID=UPI0003761642|nr:2-succinyl-6-hydroxy-2,4-cyclohexadiene-1-carboxylate synthase [Psychromonas ossibalaenae]
MPLFSQTQGNPDHPALVFLHGFLGSHRDWYETIERLKNNFYCISLDLPGHGHSVTTVSPLQDGFASCHRLIKNALDDLALQEYVLIGYSLGGRIALDYARSQNDIKIKALLLESCHSGLVSESEKEQRYKHDLKWAKRFATQSVIDSLYEWYEQDIFSDLSSEQKDLVIDKRSHNYGVCLANMLLSTSLAKQSDALPFMHSCSLPVYYCFGEKDKKFKQLSTHFTAANIQVTEFSGLGHNLHQQEPLQYAKFIQQHFSE